jgi:YebC/PmpR family DNA-binding regulatory protein
MAVAFTKISKEITLAVKKGGPDPESNLRLRVAIESAKGVNMPKDKVEAAIKRATSKEASLEEVVYEGYGPHGIAIVAETATDNPTRTVGNVRSYFQRAGGTLGTTGSLDFLFERKGVFQFASAGLNMEELELELIDSGLEDMVVEEGEVYLYTNFADFVTMQRTLSQKGIAVTSAQVQRIPLTTNELPADKAKEVEDLIERLEDDDDVQAVYHTMK